MNEREKEIAFVSASIASGCIQCLKHHKQKALSVGLTNDEILKITKYAFMVRRKSNQFNSKDLDTILNEEQLTQENLNEYPEELEGKENAASRCCD